MRVLLSCLVAGVLLAPATVAKGQVVPPASPTPASKGTAAIEQAAAAGKYLFVFFWKDQSPQTDAMWKALQSQSAALADKVAITSVLATDPAEKPLVDRYGVSRAPMPLILSLAPCGVVTKAFTLALNEDQLQAAFVTPCTERCMKALQERKLVLLCVQNGAVPVNPDAMRGVREFKADPHYAPYTEIVHLDTGDAAEARFLQDLQVAPQSADPVTVFLAPPGTMVGKFEGSVTKEELVAKLASAQSGCCPGGQCGPGGCGPKR